MKYRNENKINRIKRIEWLVQHHNIWADFPDSEYQLRGYAEWPDRCREIIETWKKIGLISSTTYHRDVRVDKMITAAREIIRAIKSKERYI